jgi:hypothetical protein
MNFANVCFLKHSLIDCDITSRVWTDLAVRDSAAIHLDVVLAVIVSCRVRAGLGLSAMLFTARRQLWAFNAVTQVVSVDESVLTRVADLLSHVVNGGIIEEAVLTIEEPHVRVLVPATRVVTPALAGSRGPGLARMAARRKLVIKVKMGCAAILLFFVC